MKETILNTYQCCHLQTIVPHSHRLSRDINKFYSILSSEPPALTEMSAEPSLSNSFSSLSRVISPSVKDTSPTTHNMINGTLMMTGARRIIAVPNGITVVREAFVILQHVLPTSGQTKSPRKQSLFLTRQQLRPF